jgi:hypothetical protein
VDEYGILLLFIRALTNLHELCWAESGNDTTGPVMPALSAGY